MSSILQFTHIHPLRYVYAAEGVDLMTIPAKFFYARSLPGHGPTLLGTVDRGIFIFYNNSMYSVPRKEDVFPQTI
jgi:hypothetical protein